MTLYQEILSKCSQQQLTQPCNYHDIAATVSVGRTKVASKLGGIGWVLETLTPSVGGTFLDVLTQAATTNSAVNWSMKLLEQDKLDFGSSATISMLQDLVNTNVIPQSNLNTIIAAVTVSDPVSWQECERAIELGE